MQYFCSDVLKFELMDVRSLVAAYISMLLNFHICNNGLGYNTQNRYGSSGN